MEKTYKFSSQNEEAMSQLQQTVNTLVETLIKTERLKRDLFFTILHSVMEENNFTLNKKISEEISIIEYIKSKRNTRGAIYEALFILDEFIHMPVKIIACPLADVVLINATVPQICKETYSICIKINRFIVTSKFGTPTAFAHLDELFTNFKDKIVTPLKSVILNYHRFPSGNLSGLPDDIILLILLILPLKDVLNLSQCCKRIYTIVKEQNLWLQLYKRDFADKNASEQSDWHDTYKDTYSLKKAEMFKLARNVGADSFEGFGVLSGHLRAADSRWEVIL